MTASTPRLAPLGEADWGEEEKELIGRTMARGRVLNIFATLVRHPKALRRWLVFANHVLFKSSLPAREREMLILRTGWLCRSEYEWGQHVEIAREIGMSEAEIAACAQGPRAALWDRFEATLLRAADELHGEQRITDATWEALSERYNEHQMIDLVYTVGNYTLVSMALNSFGVERDEGVEAFPPGEHPGIVRGEAFAGTTGERDGTG